MNNKKLTAAVASVCLVVVAVVAAVVGVLSASQQNVAGTFSVQYQANDVSAIVTLSKKAEVDANWTTPVNGTTSKTFLKTDASTTATLTIAEETLGVSNRYVVYAFAFQNTNTAYAMTVTPTYTVTVTSGKTDVNVDVQYAWGTPPTANYTNEVATVNGGSAMNTLAAHDVAKSATETLYIMVAIHDLNGDAQYLLGGENENELSFLLTRQGNNSPVAPESGVTPLSKFTINDAGQITGVAGGETLPAEVVLPSTVKGIMNDAFKNNTTMTSIVIPSSVEGIGWNAFSGSSVESVTFADTTSNWWVTEEGASSSNVSSTLASNTPAQNATLLKTTHAAAYWTKHDTAPNTLAEIGVTVTSGQANHTTSAPAEAFVEDIDPDTGEDWSYYEYGHYDLESVVIPYGVTTIGTGSFCAFWDDELNDGDGGYTSDIESIYLPSSVRIVEEGAFYECSSLTGLLVIPDSVIEVGTDAFVGVGMSSLVIGSGVADISMMFQGCRALTSVTFRGSITSIGNAAFCGCTSLTSITIPGTVVSIEESAFENCSSLASVTIPESVISIGYVAFKDCSSLTSITIPSSVGSIEGRAFEECRSLATVTINATTPPTLGDMAFHMDRAIILVGNGLGSTYRGSTGWGSYSGLIYGLDEIYNENGFLYTGSSSDRRLVRYAGSDTSVTISSDYTSIGDYAFYYNSTITSVSIGNNVTSMGNDVFLYCTSLASVNILGSVDRIGEQAFAFCSSLTSITIPSSVTIIDKWAFQNCTSLALITIEGDGSSPELSINQGVFQNCTSLTKIYLPSRVTAIIKNFYSDASYSPFYGCSSSLHIYCAASSKPTNWKTYWNYYASGKEATVTWNCTREVFNALP